MSYIKVPLNQRERFVVWDCHINGQRALCPLCVYYGYGEDITVLRRDRFEVGHLIAECKGGQRSTHNTRPICSHCNKRMGTTSLNTERFIYRHPETKVNITRPLLNNSIFPQDDPNDERADEAIPYNSCDDSDNEYESEDASSCDETCDLDQIRQICRQYGRKRRIEV